MSAEALRKDADELIRLSTLTERASVKRYLSTEADKLRKVAEVEEKKQTPAAVPAKAGIHTSKIINYGWDQSDKFLKIYVSFNGVQNFASEDISADFKAKSFELHIINQEKKCDNVLAIKGLLHEIKPSESHYKVKTDMVVIFLKKSSPENWSCITESEKKAKEPKAPKYEKNEDPSASLMTLMKQMYDDGDDDMKRTIAKAWTEARDKKSPEDMSL